MAYNYETRYNSPNYLQITTRLNRNDWIVVDICDDHYLHESVWSKSEGYAKRYKEISIDGRRVRWVEYLHRLIADAKEGEIVDHIDGDRSNNRRSNLRIVNRSINGLNTDKRLGVTYHKQDKKWYARITHNGITRGLGMYNDKDDALDAYINEKRRILK